MEAILEAVFLKILNMSLTASYIIAAVIISRLLLKRAPKKYSYALWAAAAFRLVCPVSFEAVFSLFALRLFELKTAETVSNTATTIVHIPEDIGLMARPEISTGISAMNAVINPTLPAPTTELVSVNPMQIWIFAGMLLWCLGIAVLVLFSLVNLIRLKRHLRCAVLLEGNVWQSENVRSPFILGILKAKIYIPYGLRDDELDYVLQHERHHIRRGDHIVKIVSFAILCLHWFNPLVWLAYHLMGKDMELSCDEKVLSESPGLGADYSSILLSFAANRRFPAPTPLAFSETGVKSRIRNVLRWRKPKLWVSATALLLCIAVVAACAANPKEDEDDGGVWEMHGAYVPNGCIYRSLLYSSISPAGDSGYVYHINEGGVTAVGQLSGETAWHYDAIWGWQDFPFSDEEWMDMQMMDTSFYVPLSEQYEEMLYQPLVYSEDFLLRMDGELWMVDCGERTDGSKYIWSIYRLVRQETMGYAEAHYHPAVSSRWGISLNFDIPGLEYVSVFCDDGMIASDSDGEPISFIDVSGDIPAGSRLLWNPMNINAGEGEPIMVSRARIQFTARTETQTVSGNIYVSVESDDTGYLCSFRPVGAGLHMEQDADGRISITADPEAMYDTPRVLEVDAGNPWNWTSTVAEEDISYLSSKHGMDSALLSSAEFKQQLILRLNEVQPDEVYQTDHGTPAQLILTLHEDSENSVSLLYCGDGIVELGLGGSFGDEYPPNGRIWVIENEALSQYLERVVIGNRGNLLQFEYSYTPYSLSAVPQIQFKIEGLDKIELSVSNLSFADKAGAVHEHTSSGEIPVGTLALWSPVIANTDSANQTYLTQQGQINFTLYSGSKSVQGSIYFNGEIIGETADGNGTEILYTIEFKCSDLSMYLDEETGNFVVWDLAEVFSNRW